MTLLEALNHVLRSVGESPVNSIATNHPEHEAILAEINSQNTRRQSRGWWFNKYVATVNASILPVGTVWARPLNRSLDYYANNGVLMNRRTGTPALGIVPEVEIQRLVDFTTLPQEFAEYVVAAASLAYATNFDADELHLGAIQAQLQDATTLVHRLHIRYYEIELVSRRLQGRGWWFNTYIRTLSQMDAGGLVVAPEVLFARPVRRDWDYFPRDGRLIDRATGLPVQHAVECEVREYIADFNALPQSFQDYVAAQAELDRAQDFLPESSSIQRLTQEMERHRQNAQQDHIKYARVNLFGTPYVANALSRAWGYRYRGF